MKNAWVTGASSGIGKALAQELAKRNFRVIASARTIDKTADLEGENIIKKVHDVSDYAASERLFNEITEEYGKIDLLINNAGYGLTGPAVELPLEQIEKEFAVNVFGALKLAQLVGKVMAKRRDGIIVNIGSVSGMLTTPFASAYCASKAAINSFSDGLRMELRPFGVSVVTVMPGAIVSEFGKKAAKKAADILPQNSLYEKYREKILERARISQVNATPVEKFATLLLDKVLSGNPPTVFRYGKLSGTVWFLSKFVPPKLRDAILMKKFGL